MKVFIVTSGGDYELRIRAVFSDKDAAEKHATRLREESVAPEIEVRPWSVRDEAPKFAIHSATYDFELGADFFETSPVLSLSNEHEPADVLPAAIAFRHEESNHIVGIGYGASEYEAKDNLWAAIDAYAEKNAKA